MVEGCEHLSRCGNSVLSCGGCGGKFDVLSPKLVEKSISHVVGDFRNELVFSLSDLPPAFATEPSQHALRILYGYRGSIVVHERGFHFDTNRFGDRGRLNAIREVTDQPFHNALLVFKERISFPNGKPPLSREGAVFLS